MDGSLGGLLVDWLLGAVIEPAVLAVENAAEAAAGGVICVGGGGVAAVPGAVMPEVPRLPGLLGLLEAGGGVMAATAGELGNVKPLLDLAAGGWV